MKKIMMLIILVIIVMSSCTAKDFALWEENTRERKERGRKCGYTEDGRWICGYTR